MESVAKENREKKESREEEGGEGRRERRGETREDDSIFWLDVCNGAPTEFYSPTTFFF